MAQAPQLRPEALPLRSFCQLSQPRPRTADPQAGRGPAAPPARSSIWDFTDCSPTPQRRLEAGGSGVPSCTPVVPAARLPSLILSSRGHPAPAPSPGPRSLRPARRACPLAERTAGGVARLAVAGPGPEWPLSSPRASMSDGVRGRLWGRTLKSVFSHLVLSGAMKVSVPLLGPKGRQEVWGGDFN